MRDLNVALVQTATHWHDAAANRSLFDTLIEPLCGKADLIVLTETMLSGFTREARSQAETIEGESMAWLAALAARAGAVITGSMVMREGENCFNRLVWMRPDGRYDTYDKRHLFRMAGEHERYTGGGKRLIVDLHGWSICPAVCYDLRFPVWLRNRHDRDRPGELDYDLLLLVANWPAARRYAWQTLLRARAIENLSYVVGVNRVGVDGNSISYAGDSAALDFLGQPLVDLGDAARSEIVTLSASALREHRERFPAWQDADRFELRA